MEVWYFPPVSSDVSLTDLQISGVSTIFSFLEKGNDFIIRHSSFIISDGSFINQNNASRCLERIFGGVGDGLLGWRFGIRGTRGRCRLWRI